MLLRTLCTVAAVWPLAAVAQTPAAAPAKADQRFVKQASMGGNAEIKLSQLALEKSQNSDVKTFAQKMVTDHTKAGEDLKTVATKDGLDVSDDTTKTAKSDYNKLAKLTGTDFDKKYLADMVDDHDKTVAALKKESDKGKNPDVVAWAKTTLPTVEQHDDMAKKLVASTK